MGCLGPGSVRCFQVRYEAIAAPRQGLDISRLVCGIPQGIPQAPDGSVDAVIEFDDGGVGPEAGADLVAQHHLTRMLQQDQQQLQWLVRQTNPDCAFTQFSRPYLQLERAKSNRSGGVTARGAGGVHGGRESTIFRLRRISLRFSENQPVRKFSSKYQRDALEPFAIERADCARRNACKEAIAFL